MGSVRRRFKRNIMAKNLAERLGIIPPVTKIDKYWLPPDHPVHMVYYRRTMLRVMHGLKERLKAQHATYQAQQGRRNRLSNFYNWSKSWLRRMLERIFPSLLKEVKDEAKTRRIRLRDQHAHERREQKKVIQ